jgi:hypothetical protein
MTQQTRTIDDIDQIFAMSNCINLSSNIDKFKQWLNKEHKEVSIDKVFEGYKFFIESSILTFIEAIILNSSLDIEENFTFDRARFNKIKLDKIPNTCEKIILLKNIYDKLKLIKRSKNEEELVLAIFEFRKILAIFDEIYKKILVNEKINLDKKTSLNYITQTYVWTFLNDTSRQIPHGYHISTLNNGISKKEYNEVFFGYKFALQFIWYELLGEERYYLTSLAQLHTANEWAIEDDLFEEIILVKKKDKKAIIRNDLDSYWGKVREEIIDPLEKKLKFDLNFTKIFYLEDDSYKTEINKLLLKRKNLQLNEKEILEEKLFWYQIELMNSKDIFNGVFAFSSLLVGTAELKKKINEKAYVFRFIHPDKSVKGNDFSYAVLIEARGGIGDYSGWVLFFDCATDYSGFGGSEHDFAENIIKEYENKNLIEVIEMTVDKKKFKGYIADKITKRNHRSILTELTNESKIQKNRNVTSEARGLVIELITYYTLSRKNNLKIEWNIVESKDQIDIIKEGENDLTFIDCKYNPKNYDWDKEISKLKTKSEKYPSFDNKDIKCEFWCWNRPNSEVIKKLQKENVSFITLSELIKTDSDWKGKKLDKLNTIFGTRKENF